MTEVLDGPAASPVNRSDVAFRQLHPKSVLFWQVENAVGIVALLVLGALVTAVPFVPPAWDRWVHVLVVAGVVWAGLEALVLIPRRYRYYRYALTPDSIIVEQGRLWRRRQVYPLARILYCETRQTPILGMFDLVTVRAATIVDARSIGPLSKLEADRFEQSIGGRSA